MLSTIFSQILNHQKKLDLKKLPSQGLFYKDDFKISIKKANMQDILEYETNYRNSVESVIHRVKRIVKRNIILTKGYTYYDIKSIDILFIFLEIVKFTNKSDIMIPYLDVRNHPEDMMDDIEFISFDSSNFNYFRIDEGTMEYYDEDAKEFIIDGFRYSVPSIGVEASLTRFLVEKSRLPGNEHYGDYVYSFIYFLGDKNDLQGDEIENLIQIFNEDISDSDKEIISGIISTFQPLERYTLKKDDQVINITNKLNLENIWKG